MPNSSDPPNSDFLISNFQLALPDERPFHRELAPATQDLERLLVPRQNLGDAEGMTALYEADAVLVDDDGRRVVGKDAIRDFFTDLILI